MGTSGQFCAAASSSDFSLLLCELLCVSSPWATVLQDNPAPTPVQQKDAVPIRTLSRHGYSSLHRWQCGYLLHHGILHGLQGHSPGLPGNLIFSAWSTSSPPFSQSFAVCRAVCLAGFPHSSHCCVAFCPFLHTFPQKWHHAGCGSALPCGGLVGAVWNCWGLAPGNSGSSSHGSSIAPFATKTSPPTHKALH